MKSIAVACAIIVDLGGKVLVAQRSEHMKLPLKFEFPGGKLEPGESPESCLIREIKEELNLDIAIVDAMPANGHTYPEFSIQLIPFICRVTGGELVLKEHAACFWLAASALPELDWAAADIPIVNNYLLTVKNKS